MKWSELTLQLVEAACEEDIGAGDISGALLPDYDEVVEAQVVPRQAGVIAGLALGPDICDVFSQRVDETLTFACPSGPGSGEVQDGDAVEPGQVVATVRGPRAVVLAAERTLLNFLGRMSGVATLTRQYVDAARAANPAVRVLDTRKTIPGWRELDKYAVRCGGGDNHRAGLYDAVMLKDNHLAGIPLEQLADAIHGLLSVQWPEEAQPAFIEVEVDDLAQFREVCRVPDVDVVLLDNFTPDDMRAAVAHRDAEGLRGKLALEASGGVTLATVGEIAATGIDRISVGALTHSAPGLDVGLDFC